MEATIGVEDNLEATEVTEHGVVKKSIDIPLTGVPTSAVGTSVNGPLGAPDGGVPAVDAGEPTAGAKVQATSDGALITRNAVVQGSMKRRGE